MGTNSKPISYSRNSSKNKITSSEAELNKKYATDTTRNSDQKYKLDISKKLESSLKKMELSTKNLLRKGRQNQGEIRGVLSPVHKTEDQEHVSNKGNLSSIQLNTSNSSNNKIINKFIGSNNKKINPIIKNEKSLLERKKRIVEKRLEAFSINHGDKQGGKNKSFTR
jgi:hypothetical protein